MAAHLQLVQTMATGSVDVARHFHDAVAIYERLREANRAPPDARLSTLGEYIAGIRGQFTT